VYPCANIVLNILVESACSSGCLLLSRLWDFHEMSMERCRLVDKGISQCPDPKRQKLANQCAS